MAEQYNETPETLAEDVTEGLSPAVAAAITEVLGAGQGKVSVLGAGETAPDDADVIVAGEGVVLEGVKAPVVVAAPGAALEVKSVAPTGETRAFIGGEEADFVNMDPDALGRRSKEKEKDDDVIFEGKGGNDSVTTGSGNDTVDGGTGNDSISTGAGNDSITAGTGNDTVNAGSGNDTISTGAGNDSINAGDGNDVIILGSGADSINAGDGFDIIQSSLKSTEVDISISAQGKVTLTNKATGDKTLIDDAEYLEFTDGVAQYVTGSSTGNLNISTDMLIAGLYVASFDRAPDKDGLDFWNNGVSTALSTGKSIDSVLKDQTMAGFATNDVFVNTYGNLDNTAFVDLVYKNVLGQAGDKDGLEFWEKTLDQQSRGDMIVDFVKGALEYNPADFTDSLSGNELQVAAERQQLLTNKVETSLYFIEKLGDTTNISDPSATNVNSTNQYKASVQILNEISQSGSTVVDAKALIDIASTKADPISYIIDQSSARTASEQDVQIIGATEIVFDEIF